MGEGVGREGETEAGRQAEEGGGGGSLAGRSRRMRAGEKGKKVSRRETSRKERDGGRIMEASGAGGTSWPTAAIIRRICRFLPSLKQHTGCSHY